MVTDRREFLIAGAAGAGGLLLSGTVMGCAAALGEPKRFYLPRYSTIAHEIIDIQSSHTSSIPAQEYMLLDMLLDIAVEKVSRARDLAEGKSEEALYSLQKIDDVLHKCGVTYESIRLLGDGLRKR